MAAHRLFKEMSDYYKEVEKAKKEGLEVFQVDLEAIREKRLMAGKGQFEEHVAAVKVNGGNSGSSVELPQVISRISQHYYPRGFTKSSFIALKKEDEKYPASLRRKESLLPESSCERDQAATRLNELESEWLKETSIHYDLENLMALVVFRPLPPSPYSGGTYYLEMTFPKDYPWKPPTIRFLTHILHPGLVGGRLCCCNLVELKDFWSPAITSIKLIKKIALVVFYEFDSCQCGNAELVKMNEFLEGRRIFWRKALEWTTSNFYGKWTTATHHLYSRSFQKTIETFFKIWLLSRYGKRETVLARLPFELWVRIAEEIWFETFRQRNWKSIKA